MGCESQLNIYVRRLNNMNMKKICMLPMLVLGLSYALHAFGSSRTVHKNPKATGSKATGSKATGSKATGSKATGSKATGSKATGPTIVYVHGFNLATKRPVVQIACQKKSSCEVYWPGASRAELQGKGRKTVFVGYDGRYDPTYAGRERGLTRLLSVLNANCRGSGKYCRMVVHSMGGLITGYTMAHYGRRYNITHVTSLVSAQGGSELANIGHGLDHRVVSPLARVFGTSSEAVLKFLDAVRILTTSNSRARYDHNRTNGADFYDVGGDAAKSLHWSYRWAVNLIFPGDHDTVVAMHSTCGYRSVDKLTQCGGQTKTRWKWRGWKGWKRVRTRYSLYSQHHAHPNFAQGGESTSHVDYAKLSRFAVSKF